MTSQRHLHKVVRFDPTLGTEDVDENRQTNRNFGGTIAEPRSLGRGILSVPLRDVFPTRYVRTGTEITVASFGIVNRILSRLVHSKSYHLLPVGSPNRLTYRGREDRLLGLPSRRTGLAGLQLVVLPETGLTNRGLGHVRFTAQARPKPKPRISSDCQHDFRPSGTIKGRSILTRVRRGKAARGYLGGTNGVKFRAGSVLVIHLPRAPTRCDGRLRSPDVTRLGHTRSGSATMVPLTPVRRFFVHEFTAHEHRLIRTGLLV